MQALALCDARTIGQMRSVLADGLASIGRFIVVFRKSLLLGLVAVLAGCSPAERDTTDQDNGPITNPGDDGGSATEGGGSGASTSGGASAGSAGETNGAGTGATAGGGAGDSVTSKCGAPLDTMSPTATSVTQDGPLEVASYSAGLPASSAYKSLTVFYPTRGTGPYVVVMISPGLTEILSYLQAWANRFASHGYVAVFVEANDTNRDSAQARAVGMWAGIESMKAEKSREGSPLNGKLSDCFVTSGHSLGGGASLLTAKAHPNDLKAVLGFNPYEPSTSFSNIVAPTLILTGQSDTTAGPANHGRRQYDTLLASITKQYVEAANGNHQSALFPGSVPGQYALSWIKLTVDGDTRYRPFLNEAASGLSDFATTLP